jgi:hypothetical protein
MDDGKLPLTEPNYSTVVSRLNDIPDEISDESRFGMYDSEGTGYALRMRYHIELASITAAGPWDERVYSNVHTFLEKHKPRRTLKKLTDVSDQLRKSLLEHFSLNDVLIDYADLSKMEEEDDQNGASTDNDSNQPTRRRTLWETLVQMFRYP